MGDGECACSSAHKLYMTEIAESTLMQSMPPQHHPASHQPAWHTSVHSNASEPSGAGETMTAPPLTTDPLASMVRQLEATDPLALTVQQSATDPVALTGQKSTAMLPDLSEAADSTPFLAFKGSRVPESRRCLL